MMLTVVLSVLLSLFATSVMSYISMATPIGPWIAPTLVLIGMALLRLMHKNAQLSERIVLSVAAGSVGGILGTASGFAFPTLYFLDAELFASWINNPLLFISVLFCLCFFPGWLGLWLANYFEHTLIIKEALPFPVGNMIYKVIVAQTQKITHAYNLFVGFWSTILFCILRRGMGFIPSLIPKALTVLPAFSIGVVHFPALSLSLMPMFWAIGFVSGMTIISSLFVGSIAKIILVEPIRALYFASVDTSEFTLAFCSGMVIAGVLFSFIGLAKQTLSTKEIDFFGGFSSGSIVKEQLYELGVLLLGTGLFLYYFEFGFILQLYVIFFSAVCAYQIALIAGRVGLAQLGRFATFVMVPALLLFKLNYVQTVFIATFVEMCGGVMTDILFGRKLAYLADISQDRVKKYQYFGLFISSLIVGIVFWLLLSHFQLGGSELFAQRSQGRALLIRAHHFDFWVLGVGLLFGMLLKYSPFNPMLVLGGLLMPLDLTFGFVGGALLTLCIKDQQEWIPFWSGVFAANSIWMIFQAFLRYLL